MAGLLSWLESPEGQGLLSMVAGGMASARRGQPINSLGAAGMAGLSGYANASDRITKQKEADYAKQLRDMQMQQAQLQMAKTQREDTWMAGLPGVLAPKPITEQGQNLLDQNADFGAEGMQSLTAASQYARPDAPLNMGQAPDPAAVKAYAMQPGSPVLGDIIKAQFKEPEKQQLVTTYGPNGEAIQSWVRPGESATQGAVMGAGKPEEVKPPNIRSVAQPGGMWRDMAFNPTSGIHDIPAGSIFRKGKDAAEVSVSGDKNYATQESEQSKAWGKGLGETRLSIQNAGMSAQSKLNNVARMEQLLHGVGGGKGAPTGAKIASLAASFGIKLDPRLGDKEAAAALSVEMALAAKPSGSGAMSDPEYESYLSTVPGLSNTPEGRANITATIRAKAKRDIQIAKMAREYAKANNGVIDDEFLNQASEYMYSNPLFKGQSDVRNKADEILKGGS